MKANVLSLKERNNTTMVFLLSNCRKYYICIKIVYD